MDNLTLDNYKYDESLLFEYFDKHICFMGFVPYIFNRHYLKHKIEFNLFMGYYNDPTNIIIYNNYDALERWCVKNNKMIDNPERDFMVSPDIKKQIEIEKLNIYYAYKKKQKNTTI
jgi:hypothetical protein